MPQAKTIVELLEHGKETAPAISSPDRQPLTYAGLRSHMSRTVEKLNELGIGRNDLVAIVLPNGPEMASAFVSLAAGATTAPLNPTYQENEFEFYLSDLNAKLLIVMAGVETPARSAAKNIGLSIAELSSGGEETAGLFTLAGEKVGDKPQLSGYAEPEDIALVLHTSGTTSRPKIVPLSHLNVCATAWNIQQSLALTSDDRCLNIMPLFHIHGLMAAVLGSLGAGASVCCTLGFSALKFFAWLNEVNPTWYTAVPTMHQAILDRAPRNLEIIKQSKLRFLRSSSASLPPQVMKALEETFNAPVIEAYGMTEAAHQMACNPLPPRARKPGTVGVAAGPEVSIMDKQGEHLPPGSIGEVVIRGPNVTFGYQNNPEANATEFTDGWFRTGDQGVGV